MRTTIPDIIDGRLFTESYEVRDRCLCLHLQAAARVVADRFDAALRPLGLTNGDFSLLVLLSQPQPTQGGAAAWFLAMDRATLPAVLETLEQRGLLTVVSDSAAARGGRLELTAAGVSLLMQAMPVWRAVHESLDGLLAGGNADALRDALLALAFGEL